MNRKTKKFGLIAGTIIALSSLLAGCAKQTPSVLSGDFGISLGQHAGSLSVSGYNDDLTLLAIKPAYPSPLFKDYNVNVDPQTKTVKRINAISHVNSGEDCAEKKKELFNTYKTRYAGQYRAAGNLNKATQFIGFDNANIQFVCVADSDILVSYSPNR